jgi:hypothetical protein
MLIAEIEHGKIVFLTDAPLQWLKDALSPGVGSRG